MREHETRKVCAGLSHELLINASSVMPRPTYRLLQKKFPRSQTAL